MANPPRIVMTLIAKNEVDIIKFNIEHHLKTGVDFIVATDNNSTDGTREIFLEYQQKGVLHLIDQAGDNFDVKPWNNHMAQIAYEKFKADIIIRNDADEFWYSCYGDLKKHFYDYLDIDTYNVERINVLLENRNGLEKFPQDAKYAVIKPILAQDIINESLGKNIYTYRLNSKLATSTRNNIVIILDRGNHNIAKEDQIFSSQQRKNTCPKELAIYHFPVRSKQQFHKRVVANGCGVMKNKTSRLNEKSSWHIKRFYQSFLNGGIESEYAAVLFDLKSQNELLKNGMIEKIDFNMMFS